MAPAPAMVHPHQVYQGVTPHMVNPYGYNAGLPPLVPTMVPQSYGKPAGGAYQQMPPQGSQGSSQELDQNNALVNKRRIIKRRTRTGCLTCRRRRIKCDERKPHCYNCERSKKLCLGYEIVPVPTHKDPEYLRKKAERAAVQERPTLRELAAVYNSQ